MGLIFVGKLAHETLSPTKISTFTVYYNFTLKTEKGFVYQCSLFKGEDLSVNYYTDELQSLDKAVQVKDTQLSQLQGEHCIPANEHPIQPWN